MLAGLKHSYEFLIGAEDVRNGAERERPARPLRAGRQRRHEHCVQEAVDATGLLPQGTLAPASRNAQELAGSLRPLEKRRIQSSPRATAAG